MSIWEILGISPTRDRQAIRRAYAERTKLCHPEEDPDGFAALHEAYTLAMRYARAARDELSPEEGQGNAARLGDLSASGGADLPASGGAGSPEGKLDTPVPGKGLDDAGDESAAAQYDFDAILGSAAARRQEEYESSCRKILARIDSAITGPDSRYELEDLFDSPEFLWVKDTPLFLRLLVWRLQQGLPPAGSPLAELLVAAYPPSFPPAVVGKPAAAGYAALYGVLAPLRAGQRRLQQREAERIRRRYAARVWCVVFCLFTILFFLLGVKLMRLSSFCISAVSLGLFFGFGIMARTGRLFGPEGSRRDALLRTVLTLPSYRQLPVYWIAGLWLFLVYFSGDAPFLLALCFYVLFAVLCSPRYRTLPGVVRWVVFAVAAFCVPTLPIFAVTHISTAGTVGVGLVSQLFIMPLITAVLAFLAVPAGK